MIGGLKECSNFAGEKKGTFFLVISQFSHIYFIFQSIHKFHLSGISYPVPTHQKWLPIHQNPDPTRFQTSYYPLGEKVFLGK